MPDKATEFNQQVGRRLKLLREAWGFESMRAFAGALGVNEDTYRAWEKGDNALPHLTAFVLCDRYDATWGWLLGGDDHDLPKWLRDKLREMAS